MMRNCCAMDIIHHASLNLNKYKCYYRQNELCFLGHIVEAQGIGADTVKVLAITNLQ